MFAMRAFVSRASCGRGLVRDRSSRSHAHSGPPFPIVSDASPARTASRSGPIPTPPMMGSAAGQFWVISIRPVRRGDLARGHACEHFDHAGRSAGTDAQRPDGAESSNQAGASVCRAGDGSRGPLRGASGGRRAARSRRGAIAEVDATYDLRPRADHAGRLSDAVRAGRLSLGEAAARPRAQPHARWHRLDSGPQSARSPWSGADAGRWRHASSRGGRTSRR